MENEIRYFSMFTGVGGFELGLSRSCGNVKNYGKEENTQNSERNKSILEGQQEINNSGNNREIRNTKNTDGTLFQNGQMQSNTESRNLEQIKGDIKIGYTIRQARDGILREGSRIRNDKESLQFRDDKPNSVTKRANDLSKTSWSEQGRNEGDSTNYEQVGLASKQFTCVGCSEIDKYASELLKQKFPSVKNWGDATKINPSELPDFDMLCGGFPCQAFSIAGKRRGFKDTRGTLFFDIARILKVKRPKTLLLENVKGLLNHEGGKTFRTIIQTISELGYNVQWMVLNSKFFGVPQNRERVFIIGSLRGQPRPEIFPFGKNSKELNQQGVIHPSITGAIGRQGSSKEYMRSIEVIGNLNSETWKKRNESIRRVYGAEGISPTIPTGQGGGVMTKVGIYDDYNSKMRTDHNIGTMTQNIGSKSERNGQKIIQGMKIRRLTPIECERLQGFPDNWTSGFSDTQRYKMMGNAVTVNVVQAIAERLSRSEANKND